MSDLKTRMETLRKKANSLPMSPGVYILKDSKNEIIYIGKAKALKNRVSQYFGSQKSHDIKVERMVYNVEDFNYIITDSEFEALVLECSLIKQHMPKYNILLKDDKGYSYIRVSNEKWRRISASLQKVDDGAEYIGPYKSGYLVRQAVEEAVRIFKLPVCNRRFPEDFGKRRPCLNYHIKLCSAPCTGKIKFKDYDENIEEALEFLKGGKTTSIKKLEENMYKASEELNYEKAANIRDKINAIKKMGETQKVVSNKVKEQDVIAFISDGEEGCFEVFRFREGRLYDREDFIVEDPGKNIDVRSEFILRYYTIRDDVPKNITLDESLEDLELIEKWLSHKRGNRVYITVPQRGEQHKIVQMCKRNATERLAQRKDATVKEYAVLEDLRQLLNLDILPEYIEAYDISHTGGSENVGGMIVYKNGKPFKKSYRKFKIKSFDGQDDYRSMEEMLFRRLNEYMKNNDKNKEDGFGKLPDLILLDGGKGQVSAVKKVLDHYNLNIPSFGMVKDNRHRTRALINEFGEVSIRNKRNIFTFISNIQDEVHRFAIGYHRQRRKKTTFRSSLTKIEGIGPGRAKALLKYFGTIGNIKKAELVQLENAPKMTKPAAIAVYNYYRNDK